MSRQFLVQDACGLAPLWVRRTLPRQIERPEGIAPAAPSPVSEISPPAPNSEIFPTAVDQHLQWLDWPTFHDTVASCTRCSLHKTRTCAVPGKGNVNARLLIVGEAPGEQEDQQGLPFVGKAGQLLDNILLACGYSLDDVYICNVLKCRPPANRNPAQDEIQACHDYLAWQINTVKPTMIVALGRFAAQTLLDTDTSLGKLRMGNHEYQGIPVRVSYHPAYLLRSPLEKMKAWQDWVAIKRQLATLQTS